MHSCDTVYSCASCDILLARHSVMSLYNFGMYLIYIVSYTDG